MLEETIKDENKILSALKFILKLLYAAIHAIEGCDIQDPMGDQNSNS